MAAGTTVQVQKKYTGDPNAAQGNQYVQVSLNKASNLNSTELKLARKQAGEERRKAQTIDLGGRGKEVAFDNIWSESLPRGCKPFNLTSKKYRSTIPGVTEDTDPLTLPSREEGKQICEAPIAFTEQDYPAREHDYRIFIEGVEVSGYVRGALTWTIETTGGMNSCRFDLNNNQDAFIITPLNVCSNLSLNGWRVDTYNLYSPHVHSESRYDELAKYLIYKKKFEKVAPGTGRADIDPESGMWYYPLAPFGLIFNQNDTVRVFRKLSHIDGASVTSSDSSGAKIKNFDLWAPAFAGFIRSASYDDDYVGGDRVVHIDCYDYRGLMEGMRVRTVGLPLGTNNPGSKGKTPAAKTPVETGLGSSLACLSREGVSIATYLTKIYESESRRCAYATAKQAGTNTQLTLLQLQTCNASSISAIATELGKAKDICKVFDSASLMVKKLIGEDAKLWLDATATGEVLKWIKAGRGAESGTAGSAQSGGAPTPTNSTGSVPKSGSPSISSPTSIPAEALSKYSENPTSAANVALLTTSIPAPSIIANGDEELLDALASYIDNRPVFYSPFTGKTTDKTSNCYGLPPVVYRKDNISTDDLETCCKDAAKASLSAPTYNYLIDNKQSCSLTWMGHLAALINKSVLTYTFSRLSTTVSDVLKKENGCDNNYAPPMLTSNTALTKLRIETDINSTVILTAIAKAKANLKALADPYKKTAEKAALELWNLQKDLKTKLALVLKAEAAAAGAVGNAKYSDLVRKQNEAVDAGQKKADAAGIPNAGNLAELITNEPTFDGRTAGIFADLVRRVGQGAHPLENMSYEVAVTWLCCAPTTGTGPGCRPGIKVSTWGSYESMIDTFQAWNKRILFGVAGRPLTFDEVTAIGKDSGSDSFKDPFTPYKPLLHIMLPPNGTGARTIVQQDLTANTGNSTSFQYETRKSLVDRISTLLNYQWYVSPWGDLVFEFPHYNSNPHQWGATFKEAYILDKEITGITVNEESSTLYTAWVITGMESTKEAQQAVSSQTAQNLFYKISIMCPILARRLGVRVEHVSLEIPGVGGQISDKTEAGGIESLLAWGLLHIQQQLGEAHKVSIKDFPDRPYLLPNRPIFVVPRQKLCLTKSVTYTMDKPNGEASVSIDCNFTRWLYRDGSFRQVAGGKNQIIDYSGMFTGMVSSTLGRSGEGPKSKTFGSPAKQSQDKRETAWNCNSLTQAAETSQSFYGAEIASMGSEWFQYNGNTSGAAGMPGFIPMSSGLGPNKYGSVVANIAPNPAAKGAGSPVGAAAPAAGLRIEGRKPETSSSPQNLKNLFLDPYPFGATYTGGAVIHNFGFLKTAINPGNAGGISGQPIGYAARRGNLELNWHSGVDLFTPVGENITVPFDAEIIKVKVAIGPNEKKGQATAWVPYNDQTAKFAFDSPPQLKGPPGRQEVLVYAAQYLLCEKIYKATGKRVPVVTGGGGAGGIELNLFGTISLPNGETNGMEGKNLYAKMVLMHCNSILSGEEGYFGIDTSSAKAGTPVATVGRTGTNVPHAHVELYVAKPGSAGVPAGSGDEEAYQATLKANNEFLTTQLLLKVTGGHPDSNQLSKEWQAYFAEGSALTRTTAAGYGLITTPAEAVEYLLAYQKSAQITEKDLMSEKSPGFQAVNPLMFFRPDQIVPAIKDIMDKKGWPPSNLPSFNTEAFNASIQDTQFKSSVCANISQSALEKNRTQFTECILKAKAMAASSYSSYAKAAAACRRAITNKASSGKDINNFYSEYKKIRKEQAQAEAKQKESEKAAAKLVAEQKRKLAGTPSKA